MDAAQINLLVSEAILLGKKSVVIKPEWHVSPMPGWKGLYLRWQYRLTWWMPWIRRKQKLEAEMREKETVH